MAPYDIVASFQSLEELFELMEGPERPPLPHGGAVRVHPLLLPEQEIVAYVAARVRLESMGLRLMLTPAGGLPVVELHRHQPPVERRSA